MEGRRSNRLFLNKSAPDIARIILDGWRSRFPALSDAFDYLLLGVDEGRYPPRALTFQAQQSDADFLRMVLKRNGLSWFFRASPDPAAPPAQQLVIFDDARNLPANSAGAIRYHLRNATEPYDTISLLAPAVALVGGQVTRSSWDHETAQVDVASETNAVAQGEVGDAMAAALGDARIDMPHHGDSPSDYQRLTRVDMQREEFRAACLHGVGGVRAQAVGEWNRIDDHVALDLLAPEDREYTTVRLQTWCLNGLPKELDELAHQLMARSEQGLRDWVPRPPELADGQKDSSHRYVNKFVAVRRDVPLVPPWDPRTDSPHVHTMTATVVGAENSPVRCDELGRVKVRFHGLDPDDHEHASGAGTNGDDGDSAWLRVNFLWAGDGFGVIFPLRPGMEVLVVCEQGDPSRPTIIGSRYNVENPPPCFDHLGGLPRNSALSGIVTRELGGTRQQQLRFDDTPGQIGVQLGTDDSATQLTLGTVRGKMDQGVAEPRGRGFELRTDGRGSVRGGAGVLISAEARPGGQGHVTDIDETTDRLGQGSAQHQSLSDAAHQAQAQQAGDQDVVVQALQAQLKEVQGTGAGDPANGKFPEFQTPQLVLASPAGLQASTQGSTHVVSTEHIALTSGGHTSISTSKSLLASAKGAIKLFAYNAGMKLVAAASDIDITALKNSINVLAKIDITLTANRITIAAKEEVLINGGGSSTRWNASGIVHGTSGSCLQQAASHSYSGPANTPSPELSSIDVALEETPPEGHVAFSLQHVPGQSPAQYARQPYTLLKNGGEVRKGLFDEFGRMTIDKVAKGDQYQVKLHNGVVHDVPVAADQLATDPARPQYDEEQLSNQGYRADGQGAQQRVAQRDRGADTDEAGEDAGGGSDGADGPAPDSATSA